MEQGEVFSGVIELLKSGIPLRKGSFVSGGCGASEGKENFGSAYVRLDDPILSLVKRPRRVIAAPVVIVSVST